MQYVFSTPLQVNHSRIHMNDISARVAALSPEKRKLLLQSLNNKKASVSPQIIKTHRETNRFPLSFAQQRLWFLDQLQPGNPAFNIFLPIRLTGQLNLKALKRSFNEVINRHEALRTIFTLINGEPFQVIIPNLELNIPVIDLQQSPAREAEVLQLTHQAAQLPFNLAKAPLLRVTLLRLATTEHVLLLAIHHIIADGWSIGVLTRELNILYKSFCQNQPSPLPDLPIQYVDFAVWQRQWLQGEHLAAQIRYWQHQLANISVLQLPTDYPRPTVQTFRGARQAFVLPKPTLEKLKVINAHKGITLFMTLLAAFQSLLYWYTGQEDIAIGTDIANRNQSETKDLIGFFANQLVLRTNLSGNPTFEELLQRVREITVDAYANQDLSFDKLVDIINPERRLNRSPLFQVKIILENTQSSNLDLTGLTVSPAKLENPTTQLDLLLELTEKQEGLVGVLEYDTDLFNDTTARQVLNNFEAILHHIIEQPNIYLQDLIKKITQSNKQNELIQNQKTKAEYQQKLKLIKRKIIQTHNMEVAE